MKIYIFFDESATHGIRAYPSYKKARSARAKLFKRDNRPDILQVTLPPLNLTTACALLTGEGYALEMKEIE